jgi:hypothetical protein
MNQEPKSQAPRRVFLFSGHMIDAPTRTIPRFPPDKEPIAKQALAELLTRLDAGPQDLAICGGACGGDILFGEEAVHRGTPLEIYMPFDEPTFLEVSVDFADADWRERFAVLKLRSVIHVLPVERGPLPQGQDPYEQNNLWMLEAASRFGKKRVAFICLWNGQGSDGPGGTEHLMQEVNRDEGSTYWLDTTKLWT